MGKQKTKSNTVGTTAKGGEHSEARSLCGGGVLQEADGGVQKVGEHHPIPGLAALSAKKTPRFELKAEKSQYQKKTDESRLKYSPRQTHVG